VVVVYAGWYVRPDQRDVTLIEVADRDDEIDAAYEEKYGRRYASIVPSIVTPKARAATLKSRPSALAACR
jgi:hypothetical protein